MAKDRLLVIDDERGPRESLRFLFKDTYEVTCAESVDAGIAELRKTPLTPSSWTSRCRARPASRASRRSARSTRWSPSSC